MLKNKGTYEIISPDDIGLTRANEFGIVLGKLRYHATHLSLFSSLSQIFCCDVSPGDFSHQLHSFADLVFMLQQRSPKCLNLNACMLGLLVRH